MVLRTKLAAAAGAVAAAALVLTACGGGGHDDKIASSPTASVPSTTKTPPATTTPADTGAPTFDFPSDVKVVIDADSTGDATKDAVLKDQGYGEQAIFLAIAKLDPSLPALNKYLSAEALGDWINSVKWGQSHHKSIIGSEHFYKRSVHMTSATTAGVSFCENSRDAYDKDTKTGRRINGTPSTKDFTLHYSLMRKGSDGTWRMTTYDSQPGAAKCQP